MNSFNKENECNRYDLLRTPESHELQVKAVITEDQTHSVGKSCTGSPL
jgi:hypothetical protein